MNKKDILSVWNCYKQMETYSKYKPTVINAAKGRYFVDQKGIEIFDGVSNLLTTSFGHSNESITNKIQSQYNVLDACSLFMVSHPYAIKLSKELTRHTQGRFEHFFYSNSGSEAVETALKIGLQYYYSKTNKNGKILFFNGDYHGSTIYTSMFTDDLFAKRGIDPLTQVIMVNIEDIETTSKNIEEIFKENDIAIVLTELIQLSNNCTPIPIEILKKINSLVSKNNTIWVIDEIATAFYRTGSLFLYQELGLTPDIITLGKALTNGQVPMGATGVTNQVFSEFLGDIGEGKELPHGFTSSGHPVASVAALSVLDYIEEEWDYDNYEKLCKALEYRLHLLEVSTPLIERISGKGMMYSIVFNEKTKNMTMWGEFGFSHMLEQVLLRKENLLVYADNDISILVAPQLVSTEEEIFTMIDKIERQINLLENFVKI